MRRTTAGVAGALVVALLLPGCAILDDLTREGDDDPFTAVPTPLPAGDPGELIAAEPLDVAPAGARAWRVSYHTRDLVGDDVAASGLVIVPEGDAPPGGRTVLSWAHPTTGVATGCAPSLDVDPFIGVEGLHAMLLEGYAVVAADYPGLGVAGASSYLLGVPEANSVLDIVRAAKHLPDVALGDDLLLWGHSQGGQAALFAAQRVADYAPELHLEAVAVAAPAADLTELLDDDLGDLSGVTIASYAFPAFAAAYAERFPGATLESILTPAGVTATPEMGEYCLLTDTDAIHRLAQPLVGAYTTADPSTTEPWATILRENSAGGEPIGVPIFIGQGLADELVEPSATRSFAAALCAAGESVRLEEYPGIDHGLAAYASLIPVIAWFEEAPGGTTSSTC